MKNKLKKPKLRIPVAKPGITHKSDKDYNRKVNDIELLECSVCGLQFFVVVTEKGIDLCFGCSNQKK